MAAYRRMTWVVRGAGLLFLLLLSIPCMGCQAAANTCVQEETWWGSGGGWFIWGAGGDGIFAASVEGHSFETWLWEGIRVKRGPSAQIPDDLIEGWAGKDLFLLSKLASKATAAGLEMRRLGDASLCKSWEIPRGWYAESAELSRNGQFIAVKVVENCVRPDAGFDFNATRLRVGLIGPDRESMSWAPTLKGKRGSMYVNVRRVAPSDDGGYVAIAGWDNGAAILDVKNQTVLWESRPKNEVSLVDIAWGPDNRVAYTGGASGCVWGMEVATGKVLSQWWATSTGEPVYGHRISAVAASPDGNFVAAGTGPEGSIYVWRAKTGELAKVLDHGGSTILILSFSPNSNALVSLAAGKIKVWGLESALQGTP